MIGEYYNEDCMTLMSRYKDKHFDLAIVDPPYGVNFSKYIRYKHGVSISKFERKNWDDNRPSKEYFEELFRVSKNQIIWGGNYFSEYLYSSKSFIIWDKQQPLKNFSACEYAWTSMDVLPKIFKSRHLEPYEFNIYNTIKRIHPTQKPIKLYEWVLQNYSKESDTILDTHVGSASSLIACENMNRKYVGCELDKDYYNESLKRLKFHIQSNNYNKIF